METKDFYYDLPKELIAQTPVEPRLLPPLVGDGQNKRRTGAPPFL